MIRPSPEVVAALGTFVRQHPEFLDWLNEWYNRELRQLPHAVNTPAVYQGRCQSLGEFYDLVKEAPAMAAQQAQRSR